MISFSAAAAVLSSGLPVPKPSGLEIELLCDSNLGDLLSPSLCIRMDYSSPLLPLIDPCEFCPLEYLERLCKLIT